MNNMYVTIDRISEQIAVVELEDGTYLDVPRALFPTAKEGDVISIAIAEEKTTCKKNQVQSLVDKLFKD